MFSFVSEIDYVNVIAFLSFALTSESVHSVGVACRAVRCL